MSARPQVTITLGRSGQVVKKTGHISDAVHTDYMPSPVSKRSIRERLGSNVDDPHSFGSRYGNKRQHTEFHSWSSSDGDLEDYKRYTQNMKGRRVGRDDLRLKIIHRSLSKRSNVPCDRNGDLREKISQNSHGPLRFDAHKHIPESRECGSVRRIPPTSTAEVLLHLNSSRKSYSSSPEGRRHRSPDRILGASRDMSPSRIYGDLWHVPSLRSIHLSTPTNYVAERVVDASRTDQLASKASFPVGPAKPILRAPVTSSSLQKASYMAEQPHTVASLLHALGLGKYAILFQAEEVDMVALKQMRDSDLKELGIPMGPRKKILLAVLPRKKQRRHP